MSSLRLKTNVKTKYLLPELDDGPIDVFMFYGLFPLTDLSAQQFSDNVLNAVEKLIFVLLFLIYDLFTGYLLITASKGYPYCAKE